MKPTKEDLDKYCMGLATAKYHMEKNPDEESIRKHAEEIRKCIVEGKSKELTELMPKAEHLGMFIQHMLSQPGVMEKFKHFLQSEEAKTK